MLNFINNTNMLLFCLFGDSLPGCDGEPCSSYVGMKVVELGFLGINGLYGNINELAVTAPCLDIVFCC